MACRSCDLKRMYRLLEEKKRREAEEVKALAEAAEREAEDAVKRTRKKKAYIPVEAVVEPVVETTEEVKIEEPVVG